MEYDLILVGGGLANSLIAWRLTELRAVIETPAEFGPRYFKQMAGHDN